MGSAVVYLLNAMLLSVSCVFKFSLSFLIIHKKKPLIFFRENWLEELSVIKMCSVAVPRRSPQPARFPRASLALMESGSDWLSLERGSDWLS